MSVDGIIILENSGQVELSYELQTGPLLTSRRRPIIQSGFRSTNSAYPLLHIDTLNNALSSSTRKDDVDPVLHVPGYSSDGNQSACCHVKCGDVRILAPISGDGLCLSPSSHYFALTATCSRSSVRVCVHTDVRRDPARLLRSCVSGNPQRSFRRHLPGRSLLVWQ